MLRYAQLSELSCSLVYYFRLNSLKFIILSDPVAERNVTSRQIPSVAETQLLLYRSLRGTTCCRTALAGRVLVTAGCVIRRLGARGLESGVELHFCIYRISTSIFSFGLCPIFVLEGKWCEPVFFSNYEYLTKLQIRIY